MERNSLMEKSPEIRKTFSFTGQNAVTDYPSCSRFSPASEAPAKPGSINTWPVLSQHWIWWSLLPLFKSTGKKLQVQLCFSPVMVNVVLISLHPIFFHTLFIKLFSNCSIIFQVIIIVLSPSLSHSTSLPPLQQN